MKWTRAYTKQAQKDFSKITKSLYKKKIEDLLKIIIDDPFQVPPPLEKMKPPRDNRFSRRINDQHRLVYVIYEKEKHIKITSMWTHYE
jgi:Txe/YoeB family toxin of toxin-antitoxin system